MTYMIVQQVAPDRAVLIGPRMLKTLRGYNANAVIVMGTREQVPPEDMPEIRMFLTRVMGPVEDKIYYLSDLLTGTITSGMKVSRRS